MPVAVDQPLTRMKKGVGWFTLFGALIGVLEASCFFLLGLFLPLPLSFFVTLLVDVLVTGGFHLDALCDTADGLFSSRNKERMLEIMKDSRIGSNGVLALIFYYGLIMGAIVSFQGIITFKLGILLVICLNVCGKGGISMLFYRMRYAGATEGLGTTFVGVSLYQILLSQLLALIFIGYLLGLSGIVAYFFVFLLSIVYKLVVYRKVDGLNGDTLGAFACISQVIFLLVYVGARSVLG